jgi:hypothetical protein
MNNSHKCDEKFTEAEKSPTNEIVMKNLQTKVGKFQCDFSLTRPNEGSDQIDIHATMKTMQSQLKTVMRLPVCCN